MKCMPASLRWKEISVIVALAVGSLALSDCWGQTKREKNVEILNTIWETMNSQYFESTFGGLDWRREYERYLPIVEACQTNDSLYYHLNKMLFKLGVSHLGVASPEEVNEIADPQLLLDGYAGLDVRLLNGKAIITKVFPVSSAHEMNLKLGFEITAVNHKSIEDISAKRKSEPTPPFNDRNLALMITSDIVRELYGTPGNTIDLEYLDAKNDTHSITLQLRERHLKKALVVRNMPAIYASVESRVIDDRIGYIRFDVFHPAIADSVLQLIGRYRHLPGMILDIRGNPGGEFGTRKAIAEQFVGERTLFWKYLSRGGVEEVYLTPAQLPYTGELVILVDEMSCSSSEEFSGGMKAIGRGIIIGNQTSGKVLTMKVVPLPEGALFVYPNRKTMTSRNEFLEGIGVIPDIAVELTREAILEGRDPQLERALQYLVEKE